MRIQLIALALIFTMNTHAVDDKAIDSLFKKYELIMDQKKTEYIDEVFTEKFIKESGGKAELVQKIKELPAPLLKVESQVTWKKGAKGGIYLAKMSNASDEKSKVEKQGSEFVVVEVDGKPKIDGTISDGH